jgi:Na+/proline symporter
MSPGRLLADTMIPVIILVGALVLYYLIVNRYVPSSSYLLIAAKTIPTLPVTAAALVVLLKRGEKTGHLAALAG